MTKKFIIEMTNQQIKEIQNAPGFNNNKAAMINDAMDRMNVALAKLEAGGYEN